MRRLPLWLAVRSLRHGWRQALLVTAAAAVGAAIITGALAVGDSITHTLQVQAAQRIGKIDTALIGGDRLFRAELAGAVEAAAPEHPVAAAAVLLAQGSATVPSGEWRANQTQVLGVDQAFAGFAPGGGFPHAALEQADGAETPAVVNDVLAERLRLAVGDTFILRLPPISELSTEAPLAGARQPPRPIRLRVAAIAGPDAFGRFSLYPNPAPPPTVFLPRSVVADALEAENLANLLLLRGPDGDTLDTGTTARLLRQAHTPADLGLRLARLPESGQWEITSRRVFIDAAITHSVRERWPRARPQLSYFVNTVAAAGRESPFAFAAAIHPATVDFLPADFGPGDIAVTRWLADDLDLAPGDSLRLEYFVADAGADLVRREADFTLRTILPMEGAPVSPHWTPEFPGITEAEDTGDWDSSLPIDVSRSRDKDEAYWDEWRAVPKIFVTFEEGQELWGNRWGGATAIRLPAGPGEAEIRAGLRAALGPSTVGLTPRPLRQEALAASRPAVDFAGLFLGFGFFIVVSAMALTALLFHLMLGERRGQVGLLFAIGWTRRQVRGLLLAEVLALGLLASLAGIPAGLALTALLIEWVEWLWPQGDLRILFHIGFDSLCYALLASTALPVLTLLRPILRISRASPARLAAGGAAAETSGSGRAGPARAWLATAGLCLLGALAALAWAVANPLAPGAFFASAFLLVLTGLAAFRVFLARKDRDGEPALALPDLAWREAARQPGRNLAVAGALAAGTFLVIASSAFHKQTPEGNPEAGPMGGFSLVGSSNQAIGEAFTDAAGDPLPTVGFRVSEGASATCLNLSSVASPRILGVDPSEMAGRFTFAATLGEREPDWERLLAGSSDAETVPAIVDQTTLLWALKMKVGDELTALAEDGRSFTLGIVAALQPGILQGGLIISRDAYLDHFPGDDGPRFFLIEAPAPLDALRRELNRRHGDEGLQTRPAREILAEYNAVENAYLSMFQVLGGFGLVLGTVAVGLVAARNLQERRRPLSLLLAVGWTRRQIAALARRELLASAGAGLAIGILSSALAVGPQLLRAGDEGFAWPLLGALLLLLVAGSHLCIALAVRIHVRQLDPGHLNEP